MYRGSPSKPSWSHLDAQCPRGCNLEDFKTTFKQTIYENIAMHFTDVLNNAYTSVWIELTGYGLVLVDLGKTCCTGDCPRTTVVTVVSNKRQTTSPVYATLSTDRLRGSMASLVWMMRREHGSRTMLWTYEWCVMAHARRRSVWTMKALIDVNIGARKSLSWSVVECGHLTKEPLMFILISNTINHHFVSVSVGIVLNIQITVICTLDLG